MPHPEIDRILVNDKPRMLSARVADGDCICVYPTARTAAGYIGNGAHWDMLNAFVERVKARLACTSV